MSEFSIGILMGIGIATPILASKKWAAVFLLNLIVALMVGALASGPVEFCTVARAISSMAASHADLAAGIAVGFITATVLRMIFGLSHEEGK
ncbi:MAG: hypothetical protein KGJ49_04905 [Alphaproteobacteria bacterium]|nr:hypothetical protein [Alphaproteobacteria bacterium]